MAKGKAVAGAAKGLFAPIEKWLRTKGLRKGGAHHVFRGEMRRGPGGGVRPSGWHHRFMGVDPPDRRVTQVTQRDVTGAYRAEVEFNGPNGWVPKHGGSSFFPDSWTPQEVHRAITEAHANGSVVPGTNGRRWQGSANGVNIQGSYHPNGRTWNSGWPVF
jgi:hypothetical protein